MASQNLPELPEFNSLWNYGKPEETRLKFQDILTQFENSADASYLAELLTQIARTYSLQSHFDQCHEILDRVEKMLGPGLDRAGILYLLERGRAYNSAGMGEKAMPFFLEAFELGLQKHERKHAIDAVHMIAIAEKDPNTQVWWNLKGIAMAEADEKSQGWLNALYNNIGESYLSLKDYKNARLYFQKLADRQTAKNGEADMYTLKDVARAIRLSGSPKEALAITQRILGNLETNNLDNGWIREEIAEALQSLEESAQAKPHFVKAYQ